MLPNSSTRSTHHALSQFLSSFFPARAKDVPFHYHIPRSPTYEPSTAYTIHVVLSITPTSGVYGTLNRYSLCFLHRPFGLDRRRVPQSAVVLSSHVGFDEVLTVGWNTALATRLGMSIPDCACVQGYKGDPERRIGIVGPVAGVSLPVIVQSIQQEFGGAGELFEYAGADTGVRVVAIMNAFHPDEIERVLRIARERGWLPGSGYARELLYLTGQPRNYGLEAAKAAGLNVVCVGHRAAEEWGIRFLAAKLREAFPTLKVEEVYEEEEVIERLARRLAAAPVGS